MHFFSPADSIRQTYWHFSFAISKKVIHWWFWYLALINQDSWFYTGICVPAQNTLSWDRKWIWCLLLKSAFSKCFIQQMTRWLYKNCSKNQTLENRFDLYNPAYGPFNYHIKVKCKCKCLYQFLISLTLSISIRQIFRF